MQHLIDTKIKLATCNRCGAYVLAAMVGGVRCAADPTPLDVQDRVRALVGGVKLYKLVVQAGRPWRLDFATVDTLRGSAGHLRAHGCGCAAMDATAFDGDPVDPPQAPARHGRTADGFRLPLAHVGASQKVLEGPEAASTANRRPSELRAIRCAECRKLIPRDDPNRFQVEVPLDYTRLVKTRARPGKPSETSEVYEVGTLTWAVHSERCVP